VEYLTDQCQHLFGFFPALAQRHDIVSVTRRDSFPVQTSKLSE
jgi:hypothetical protein